MKYKVLGAEFSLGPKVLPNTYKHSSYRVGFVIFFWPSIENWMGIETRGRIPFQSQCLEVVKEEPTLCPARYSLFCSPEISLSKLPQAFL